VVSRTQRHPHDRGKPARLQGIRHTNSLAGCGSDHGRSQIQHLLDTDGTLDPTNRLPSSRRDQLAQYRAADAAKQINLY
jgi:hypothetical protein